MDKKSSTIVNKRGQTVVPALIRNKYGIKAGDRMIWLDDGETIKVIPIPEDVIHALRGRGKGEKLVEALLASRHKDLLRRP